MSRFLAYWCKKFQSLTQNGYFQYDGGWPTSMEMPPTSMYGGDPHSRAALDQLSAAHAQQAAASHMNHAAAAAAMHNPYVAAAASAAGTNHTGSGNHVMSGQVPDVHKRDKDAIYG